MLRNFVLWCNGSTTDSGPVSPGSNPGRTTRSRFQSMEAASLLLCPSCFKAKRGRRALATPFPEQGEVAKCRCRGTMGQSGVAKWHCRGTMGQSEVAKCRCRGTTGQSGGAKWHCRGTMGQSEVAKGHRRGTMGQSEVAKGHRRGTTKRQDRVESIMRDSGKGKCREKLELGRKIRAGKRPARMKLCLKVLDYRVASLSSVPNFFMAAIILRVVCSPAKADPLLYCRILLSLMPA